MPLPVETPVKFREIYFRLLLSSHTLIHANFTLVNIDVSTKWVKPGPILFDIRSGVSITSYFNEVLIAHLSLILSFPAKFPCLVFNTPSYSYLMSFSDLEIVVVPYCRSF